MTVPVNFDPTTPTELQRQDWTCSIRSVMWLLKSIGIDVTPEEAQDAMSPQYVTPALGLLDGSGGGIVAVLRDHWGVGAYNDANTSFDSVAAVAGKQPVAIGLHNWGGSGHGHWSAVRGFDGERLWLANPGGTGPTYGQQSLTREEFNARGPGAMVTIPIGAPPAPDPTPPALDRAAIVQGLRSLLAKHIAYDEQMRADFDRLIAQAEAL